MSPAGHTLASGARRDGRPTVGTIKLLRTGCFGECPAYQVTLRRNGIATWQGERFVARIGEFDGKVEPQAFALLADFVQRCGFFDWADDYRPGYEVTDGPTAVIVATRGRLTKRVQQYETDQPPDFWVIATLVDALAEQIAWEPPV